MKLFHSCFCDGFKSFRVVFTFFLVVQSVTAQVRFRDSLESKRKNLESLKDFNETDTTYIKTIYQLANSYAYHNRDSMLQLASKSLEISKKEGYSKGIAGSNLALATAHMLSGKFSKAFEHAQLTERLSKEIKADTIYLRTLNVLGMGHFMKGEYPKGYLVCQKGKMESERTNNKEMQVVFNMNIATSFAILRDAERALPYYQNCLKLLKTMNDEVQLAEVLSNLGYSFIQKGEYVKARKYSHDALHIFETHRIGAWTAFVYINLGEIALKQKEFDKAIANFKKSEQLLLDIDDKQREAETYLGLAASYLMKNELRLSESYALRAETISRSINLYPGLIRAFDILYQIHKEKNQPELAIAYLEASGNLADSIQVADNTTKFLMLEAENNFGEEQKRIEIENNKKLERQKAITYLSIVLLIPFLAILFLIRRNIKTQKIANEQLIQINATKDKVFSIIGHDLKAPINTLQELLALYKNKGITEKQIAKITPRLKENVDHSAFTLNNLLFWAQKQMNGISAVPEPVNLKGVIDEIIVLYQEQIAKKELLVVHKEGDTIQIFVDKEHIKIILRNIIFNAIKYSDKKGEIRITYAVESEETVIEICDSGIGMDKNMVNSILNGRNIVSNPGTDNEKGTGLGLDICKELLKINKGRLHIESTPNTGSCFKLFFKTKGN